MIWFVLLVLTLAAYRGTRLVTRDTFPPVLWLRDILAGGWRPLTDREQRDLVVLPLPKAREMRALWSVRDIGGEPHRYVYRASWSPFWLAELITCPWCASAYVAGALTFVTDMTVGLPVPWLVGPAVWAGAALLASKEWA